MPSIPADFGRSYWRSAATAAIVLNPLHSGSVDDATLRLVAENIPALCWVANGDGYIVWYNRSWHDYCGSTPEEMEFLSEIPNAKAEAARKEITNIIRTQDKEGAKDPTPGLSPTCRCENRRSRIRLDFGRVSKDGEGPRDDRDARHERPDS